MCKIVHLISEPNQTILVIRASDRGHSPRTDLVLARNSFYQTKRRNPRAELVRTNELHLGQIRGRTLTRCDWWWYRLRIQINYYYDIVLVYNMAITIPYAGFLIECGCTRGLIDIGEACTINAM